MTLAHIPAGAKFVTSVQAIRSPPSPLGGEFFYKMVREGRIAQQHPYPGSRPAYSVAQIDGLYVNPSDDQSGAQKGDQISPQKNLGFSIFNWYGRGDLNPHGLAPHGFSYQLRLSPPPLGALWSGLSLHPSFRLRRCPSSLYTFPLSGAWLGIAI